MNNTGGGNSEAEAIQDFTEDLQDPNKSGEQIIEDTGEKFGTETLKKSGVPEPLARHATKTGGGLFSPARPTLANKAAKKVAGKGLDKFRGKKPNKNYDFGKKNADDKEEKGLSKSDKLGDKNSLGKTDENSDNKNNNPIANKTKQVASQAANQLKAQAKEGIKQVFIKLIQSPAGPYIIAGIAIALVLFIVILLIIMMAGGASAASANDGSYCGTSYVGDIPMKSTPLSKSEFVEKTISYISASKLNSNLKAAFTNRSDVEYIYDYATSNNVNPEMIVIRATLENSNNPSECPNNYWGYGMTNKSNKSWCKFSSFRAGVKKIAENLSQYDTLSAMNSRYAQLGEYWYNPGSSGKGGCYMFTNNLINEYMSSERRAEVEKICSSTAPKCDTNDGAGCTPTTQEDKDAYTQYQNSSSIKRREAIYGITSSSTSQTTSSGVTAHQGTLTYYNQSHPSWNEGLYYDVNGGTRTIASGGCAPTSTAMLVTALAQRVTPYEIGQLFIKNGYRDSGVGLKNPDQAFEFISKTYNLNYLRISASSGYLTQAQINQALDYIKRGYYAIVNVKAGGTFTVSGHYIFVIGVNSDNEIVIYDPNLILGDTGKLNEQTSTYTHDKTGKYGSVPAKIITSAKNSNSGIRIDEANKTVYYKIDKFLDARPEDFYLFEGTGNIGCGSANGEGLQKDSKTGFIMRVSRATTDNSYFYDQSTKLGNVDGSLEGECVWYARARVKEILAQRGSTDTLPIRGNGGTWCDGYKNLSVKPFDISYNINDVRQGDVIVWGKNGANHVAIVEQTPDTNPNGKYLISQAGLGYGPKASVGCSRGSCVSGTSVTVTATSRHRYCESDGSGCQKIQEMTIENLKNYSASNSFSCVIHLVK